MVVSLILYSRAKKCLILDIAYDAEENGKKKE